MSGAVTAGAPPELLGRPFGAWLRRAHEVVAASAEELNRLNVFPVSDSDTGTNVQLTLAGILAALPEPDATPGRPSAEDLVRAAVLSAHGNSGAILAEMLITLGREIAEATPDRVTGGTLAAQCLRAAAEGANRAVARPVAGTILTVADDAAAAADVAAAENPGDALAVVEAARRAAADSLARTPELLDVLAEAGVVDAGAAAYVLLLDVLAETFGGEPAEPLTGPAATTAEESGPVGRGPVDVALPARNEATYEVMYALRGAAADALAELREELSAHGGSVVVVGNESLASVHVHLADAGAAVEAGLARGGLSQVRITVLPPTPPTTSRTTSRTVIAVVAGPGLAGAVRDLGGVPVLPAQSHVGLDELAGALDDHLAQHCAEVVILPNDMESLELANHLAAARRNQGRRIAVIPTTAQVQGLAAMAVHEPTADFDSAVVAMSATAGHARHGAVTIAEMPAMTMAGRCEVGDVLGLLDGDFVDIGSSVLEVAQSVIARLRAGGGELLTLITGADVDPDVVDQVKRREPDLEVEVVAGGQRRYLLLIGLE